MEIIIKLTAQAKGTPEFFIIKLGTTDFNCSPMDTWL